MASIKDGAANNAPTKKSEVKQMPLTFKTKDSLEMALFDFLKSKRNRGIFIKELLINAMFSECPEMATKFGAGAVVDHTATKIITNPIKVQVTPQEHATAPTDGDTTAATHDSDTDIGGNNESVVTITRGKNTLSMF